MSLILAEKITSCSLQQGSGIIPAGHLTTFIFRTGGLWRLLGRLTSYEKHVWRGQGKAFKPQSLYQLSGMVVMGSC